MDDPAKYLQLLGTEVDVVVDRPIGCVHPDFPTLRYLTNYGYVPGTLAGDGEEIDAYVLGVEDPVRHFRGRCIAVILRRNDDEHKLVVARGHHDLESIVEQTAYVERDFETEVIMAGSQRQASMTFIREHRRQWAEAFETIRSFLLAGLGADTTVHHVGSTSIPGMPAKDIIDIDIECRGGGLDAVVSDLAALGYRHVGDQGIATREVFKVIDGAALKLPAHHLYACEADSPELARHLAFKRYLLARPDRAAWLAQEKRHCDAISATKAEYMSCKSTAYGEILREALRWASSNRHGADERD